MIIAFHFYPGRKTIVFSSYWWKDWRKRESKTIETCCEKAQPAQSQHYFLFYLFSFFSFPRRRVLNGWGQSGRVYNLPLPDAFGNIHPRSETIIRKGKKNLFPAFKLRFSLRWVGSSRSIHNPKLAELRSCVNEGWGERPGLPVPNVRSLWIQSNIKLELTPITAQELCEGRGGRPAPSLTVHAISVDVKRHWTWTVTDQSSRAVWKSRWPSRAYGLCVFNCKIT